MRTLRLNCWVRGQDVGRTFRVDIPETETVSALKEAVKDKNPNTFRGIDSLALDLYKPNDPVLIPHKDNLQKFTLSNHARHLGTGVEELSGIFPEPLPKHEIHLIIDAPYLTLICWLRGDALAASFQVSIPANAPVDRLKDDIKTLQPNLTNVHGQQMRLYRISGDESELRESLGKVDDGEALQGAALLPNFLTVPVLDPFHVVAEVTCNTRVNKPSSLAISGHHRGDPVAAARESFVKARPKKKSPSDGSNPSSFHKTQQVNSTQIPCGRPRNPEELIPVTLLHPVFGQFMEDCQTGRMTEDDNQFAGKLANAMSDLYQNETQRVKELDMIFKATCLNLNVNEKIPGTNYVMDASLSAGDPSLPPYFIAEFKNEVATSKSEPYMQAVAYYLEATKTQAPRMSNSTLPCFLLVAFGPYVVFAGAVWNLRPVVQVLSTPLAFHYHSTDTQSQLITARHMAAFRKALRMLSIYYEDFSNGLVNKNQSDDALFPYFAQFKSLDDGSTQAICYRKQLEEGGEKKGLLFFGTLESDPTTQVCVKFVRRYSKEAHLHCATLGFAPKLRGFEVLPGGWYMIVMDRLVGYDLLADLPGTDPLPRSTLEAIRMQLKTLHARQMVHGDIRDTNILIKKDDRTKFMVIDFDWAGEEGTVRYPPYVNHVDLQRPKEARDGLLIKAAHDLEMLDFIAEAQAAKNL